jgi:hypothetical protein
MIPALLLVVLTSGLVSVPASHWATIDLPIRQPNTTLDISFQVTHGSRVQVLVLDREQARRFHRGRSIDPLLTTGFQNSGRLRYRIAEKGEYVLLLDNRIEGRGPTLVDLRIETSPAGRVDVRELPPERRRVVVTLSLLFFGATVFFSARQLLKHS